MERQKPESNLVALERASCFTCRQLIYFLWVLQSYRCFFLLFLQDDIRLTEWITRRTFSYQFSHKAPLTSLSVMMLTFSEPRPILCHFTVDLYSHWSYRRNEIMDRDSFQGPCLCFRRGPRVNYWQPQTLKIAWNVKMVLGFQSARGFSPHLSSLYIVYEQASIKICSAK